MNITSGKEWRKPREEGIPVQLPSGKVARIRPFTTETLLALGRVPDGLKQIIWEIATGQRDDLPATETPENLQMHLDYLDSVVRTCFVEPCIVDDPQADNEIALIDVERRDKQFVAGFINIPASELVTFLEEQDTSLEPVADGKKSRSKAK